MPQTLPPAFSAGGLSFNGIKVFCGFTTLLSVVRHSSDCRWPKWLRVIIVGTNRVFEYLLMIVFPGAMAFAAAMDLITMTIPNKVSIVLVAAFFLLAPLAGLGLYDIALHVSAGIVTLAATFLFFTRGWIGGGDAKLFAAAALWLGFEHLADFAIVSALLGGALTLGLLFVRKIPLPMALFGQSWIVRLHSIEEGIPYGIALGTAGLIVYPWTPWMQSLLH